jgi:transcription elongation GreA/GreB family factor
MSASKKKERLKNELIEALTATLANARKAHRAAVEGATHGEAKQENDKDTRGLEQSYVARGQSIRIAALEAEITDVRMMALSPGQIIGIGSLVSVGEDRTYFIAPHGGGVGLGKVQVVTPKSPIGQALLGKTVGDEVEVMRRVLEITEVQ